MRLPPPSAAGERDAGAWQGSSHLRALLVALGCASCGGQQQFAELGDFTTSRGEVIRDCRLGYRTYGRLDAKRSNAVLITPWFLGTSGALGREIGGPGLIDSSRFFVVAVDSLGNGVSSSPSNSPLQPGIGFPRLSMEDLVRSQRRLLTNVLGIHHLHAVVGTSMGGMQALGWATGEPTFADVVVSIAGSPRSTEGDRRHWESARIAVRSTGAWRRALQALGRLAPLEAFRQLTMDKEDFLVQAEAVQTLDLTTKTGGSLERLAAEVRTRLLLVLSERDEVVDPAPAREFARLSGAELLLLDGRCGHRAVTCERKRVLAAVRRFLEPEQDSSQGASGTR